MPTTAAAAPSAGRAASGDAREDFEAEIRIEQSVHLVAQLPTLVIGNCMGVLIGFLLAVDHVPWWHSLAWLWIVLLTIPMALNWLKLRKTPRPARVSRRRIRLAGWHSLVMGLSWTAVPLLFLPQLPMINQSSILFGIIVLCTGSVASISALPVSAMAYFVPMMTMVFYVTAVHGSLPYRPVTVLSGLMFVALFGFLRQNWNTFRRNVAIAVERTRLAEIQAQEVQRRAAAEQELRAAKDEAVAAEAEVRAAQERLESIIEALPLPIAIFRLRDAQTVYANKWVAELVGLSPEAMLEHKSGDFAFNADENRKVLDGLRGGRTVIDHETVIRRADGAIVPIRLASILMEYEGEKAILTAVEDITLRKQHEEQIEQSRRAAEDASRAKSQFLANMSHELRTPLNAVLGYAELMADGIYGELPPRAVEVLGRIQANGAHLLGLINDVLDLSKIEAGQLKLQIEPYGWSGILQSVAAATEALAKAKSLELRTRVEPGLPMGRGDERRLTQVILNLVSNAIKFTEKGYVEMSARRVDGGFEVAVADTGTGIAEADQQRIFEEFQQVDNTSTRKKGGTGLGLAISRRIAEMHGGTIGVRSVPGEGSTFFVRLPLEAPAQEEGGTA